jgi:hypothetical protein
LRRQPTLAIFSLPVMIRNSRYKRTSSGCLAKYALLSEMATNISPIAIVRRRQSRVSLRQSLTIPQVGIAVELPSGTYAEKNLARDAFTQFLLEKGESYETIPTERFNADA